MLALRNIVCNNRWDEAWPHIATALRHEASQRRADRRTQHRNEAAPSPIPPPQPASATVTLSTPPSPILLPDPLVTPAPLDTPPVPPHAIVAPAPRPENLDGHPL